MTGIIICPISQRILDRGLTRGRPGAGVRNGHVVLYVGILLIRLFTVLTPSAGRVRSVFRFLAVEPLRKQIRNVKRVK
jgi:hypothetical protein